MIVLENCPPFVSYLRSVGDSQKALGTWVSAVVVNDVAAVVDTVSAVGPHVGTDQKEKEFDVTSTNHQGNECRGDDFIATKWSSI